MHYKHNSRKPLFTFNTSLYRSKKFLLFALFQFFMGLGYTWGFNAGHSLFIHQVGTKGLFAVHASGAMLALFISAGFYFLSDRISRSRIFCSSFLGLGMAIFACAFGFSRGNSDPAFYYAIRIFLCTAFTLSHLVYWFSVSGQWTHGEAKKIYPLLVASGVSGEMMGASLMNLLAQTLHLLSFIYFWGFLLILITFLFSRNKKCLSIEARPSSLENQARTSNPKMLQRPGRASYALVFLLFVFWMMNSFISNGTDYIFNSLALKQHAPVEWTASLFSKVVMGGTSCILLFQLLLAMPFSLRFSLHRMIFFIAFVGCALLEASFLFPNLYSAAFAQGFHYFFMDSAGVALLGTAVNILPSQIQGRSIALIEGAGRPLGSGILLYLTHMIPEASQLGFIASFIFAASALFLIYPLVFRRIYAQRLAEHLSQKQEEELIEKRARTKSAKGIEAALSIHNEFRAPKRHVFPFVLPRIQKNALRAFPNTEPALHLDKQAHGMNFSNMIVHPQGLPENNIEDKARDNVYS